MGLMSTATAERPNMAVLLGGPADGMLVPNFGNSFEVPNAGGAGPFSAVIYVRTGTREFTYKPPLPPR
jgi:hypothetical protein